MTKPSGHQARLRRGNASPNDGLMNRFSVNSGALNGLGRDQAFESLTNRHSP